LIYFLTKAGKENNSKHNKNKKQEKETYSRYHYLFIFEKKITICILFIDKEASNIEFKF